MTNKPLILPYYTDPGHGWVQVKRKLLDELGIYKEITTFSYQRGESVYLEEDCDFPLFKKACDKQGIVVQLESQHTDRRSLIRSYERFSARQF